MQSHFNLRNKSHKFLINLNSLTLRVTKTLLHLQYNIQQTSDENRKNINYGIIRWSNTKFSKLTL